MKNVVKRDTVKGVKNVVKRDTVKGVKTINHKHLYKVSQVRNKLIVFFYLSHNNYPINSQATNKRDHKVRVLFHTTFCTITIFINSHPVGVEHKTLVFHVSL